MSGIVTNECNTIVVSGLPALMCENPKILILGSRHGYGSLTAGEYYHDNNNRIWKVLSGVFQERIPRNYVEEGSMLAHHGVVLWDFYKQVACLNNGDSSDKSIVKDERTQINDIVGFLKEHSTIDTVAINGFGKFKTFSRQIREFSNPQILGREIRILRLPETSGLNVNHGYGDINKMISEWSALL